MNDMIKAERGKIISKKPTKILFVMGIILIVAYFFLFQFGYTSVFYSNRQVIGRIDKKCRESDNVRMTYVNDDSDG